MYMQHTCNISNTYTGLSSRQWPNRKMLAGQQKNLETAFGDNPQLHIDSKVCA